MGIDAFRREVEGEWLAQQEQCEVDSHFGRCPGVATFAVRFEAGFAKVCGSCLPGQLHTALKRRGEAALVSRLDMGTGSEEPGGRRPPSKVDTALVKHLVLDHNQRGAEIAALDQDALEDRHRAVHVRGQR